MDIDKTGIPLADFVRALRAEVRDAQADTDPEIPIEVGPIVVEFTVLSRQEAEGRAGIRFWVVDAGISGTLASESTQKVTMELQPLDAAGRGRARIRDRERR